MSNATFHVELKGSPDAAISVVTGSDPQFMFAGAIGGQKVSGNAQIARSIFGEDLVTVASEEFEVYEYTSLPGIKTLAVAWFIGVPGPLGTAQASLEVTAVESGRIIASTGGLQTCIGASPAEITP
jgi:hypothetical protein